MTEITEPTASPARSEYTFGAFRLLAEERVLLEDNRPVRVGNRAIEVLIALVTRAGVLVSRRELMATVWPDTVVVDANLNVHIGALRRVLGDGRAGHRYIVSDPGRGYRFVAPVSSDERPSAAPSLAAPVTPNNLPAQLTRLIGRDDVVADLVGRLPVQRLITIVGPGGIGKTAVALNVAERLVSAYDDGVWLIDLASLDDPALVTVTVASTLRVDLRADDPLPGLVAALKNKHVLLVLDNCEHLVEAAAELTAALLTGARRVAVLATSREPLRVKGEQAHRLSPLQSPPTGAAVSAAQALGFPAVQLFVERAKAIVNDFELADAEAYIAADICRRLDGIPLAIEFAAARVDMFGVHGLAAGLQGPLLSVPGRWRGSAPRYQTLEAALDWSYRLLTPSEQTLFGRLSIFAGGFALESVQVVAGGPADDSAFADDLAHLVLKSLVFADISGREVRFRLLETTRAFAARQLEERGETDALGRRHAVHFHDMLLLAIQAAGDGSPCKHELDNIRSALRWAFSAGGDGAIGIALAAASAPLWLEMSLLTECRTWMERALRGLGSSERGDRQEMALQTALGTSLMFTEGMSDKALAALKRALELAVAQKDFNYHLRVFGGMTLFRLRVGDFVSALTMAREFESVANLAGDPVAMATADCMLASSLVGVADFAGAVESARRGWARGTEEVRRAQIARSGLDHSSVQARTVLAITLWIQGAVDESNLVIRDLIDDATDIGHPVSLGFALNWSLFGLSLGEQMHAGAPWIARLGRHAEQHALTSYAACCRGFEGLLCIERGDIVNAERLLRACLQGLRDARFEVTYTRFSVGLCETLRRAGRFDESLATMAEAMRNIERGHDFIIAEAVRLEGEIHLSAHPTDSVRAQALFQRSLALASDQKALSWQLRAAQSLGRVYAAEGRFREAHDVLAAVYDRFTEGFDTPDLRKSRGLLGSWRKSAT